MMNHKNKSRHLSNQLSEHKILFQFGTNDCKTITENIGGFSKSRLSLFHWTLISARRQIRNQKHQQILLPGRESQWVYCWRFDKKVEKLFTSFIINSCDIYARCVNFTRMRGKGNEKWIEASSNRIIIFELLSSLSLGYEWIKFEFIITSHKNIFSFSLSRDLDVSCQLQNVQTFYIRYFPDICPILQL